MKYLLLAACLISFSFGLHAQYKNDNVLYRTVFPQDLCREMEKNPGYVLLDVRSAGEFNDTSSSTGLNIGHLEGALNFDSRQIGSRIRQLAAFKNDPVFVYCSHSQRSRRASKMLADSGFTNVININGGLTGLYALNPLQKACIDAMLRSNNSYRIISSPELCRKLADKYNTIYLLDVRSDSAWNHISLNAKQNAYGHLKGAKHIALDQIKSRLNDIPKGKEIVITDLFGNDAANAARILKENGYDKVTILLEGMERWLSSDKKDWGCTKDVYVPSVSYQLMSAGEFSRFLPANKNVVLIDLRSADEYAGNHKVSFRNIGHLENALNIPSEELEKKMGEMASYKSLPVVLYEFSDPPTVYAAADLLTKNGFSKVYVLAGGLFNIRWTAANVPGMAFMHEWVKDVPEANR